MNLPTGQLFGKGATYNIQTAGQLNNAEQFKPVIVTYRNGAPVRLEQVANVIDSVESVYTASWLSTGRNASGKVDVERAITMQTFHASARHATPSRSPTR